MFEKVRKQFDKTFEHFDKTFKYLDEEMSKAFATLSKSGKSIKIKIGKGSIVRINGVLAKLENDCIVVTSDPHALMTLQKAETSKEKDFVAKS